MRIQREKIQQLLDERGWINKNFAYKLGLNTSYVYRVIRGDRGGGKKFIARLMVFCEKEGLNFRDFIVLDDSE